MISLIVAKAENNVIGYKNAMPWRIPAELQYFKQCTMGKPMIMGRKTFDSLGRVLPGRPHIVISRQVLDLPENCYLASSLQSAFDIGQRLLSDSNDEMIVIGGADIYRQAMLHVDTLYVTEVHLKPEGDTFFPDIDQQIWQRTEHEYVPADLDSAIAYGIVTYQRRKD